MTSDIASSSPERTNLDYALGKRRVSLAGLTPEEFDTLLQETLDDIDLRKLHGFKPLISYLAKTPGSFRTDQRVDPLEHIVVTSNARLELRSENCPPFIFETQVISAVRGALSYVATYRRYESDEETDDYQVAREWGAGQAYPTRLEIETLALRRPNDHTKASSNLFAIKFVARKVPHEDRMLVALIQIAQVLVPNFRSRFYQTYAEVGQNLIWELASLYRQTYADLETKANLFRDRTLELERLSRSISA